MELSFPGHASTYLSSPNTAQNSNQLSFPGRQVDTLERRGHRIFRPRELAVFDRKHLITGLQLLARLDKLASVGLEFICRQEFGETVDGNESLDNVCGDLAELS